jgi:archaellum component FlaC
MNNLLNNYTEKAIRSFNWTSFSPEKRGQQLIECYNGQLFEDIEELKKQGIEIEVIEGYKTRYISLFNSWLSAKSNTFSAMITGTAKFPTRRHEKANRSEQRHYELWQEWRLRAKKAIIRKSKPEKTYNSEIERYKQELENLKKNHELMKQGNIRIKQAKKTGEDLTKYLTETFGIKPHMIDWTFRFGFGLQNSNANIKRIEGRIKDLEAKEQNREENPERSFNFEGGQVILNYEIDRLQIKHDSKPDQEIINQLKRSGFKWSPSQQAWQRQLTMNAIWTVKHTLKLTAI